ncbi:type III-B CRISPR module RAMP protein Cmr1 [Runella sp. SP2]|uniref:type III-B CRISPR module RAMP protein Cmr1 n=1 Tax=Runella sp. SP2 TaxID=2268026 RepID=UPI0013DE355A|nr:type III-B CRISPR module RAMP protein Cmr1 [Runella sp. SP2]
MQTITFTCEVITPMFLAGADGTHPELRPASIKGALRFWWRAMNGHLEWKKMLELEGKIFGNTQQRSSLIIRIEKDLKDISKAPLLPHKGGSLTPCFPKSDESFIVKFSLTKIENDFTLESIKALFILTSILGGLGKRSRRGFGSFKITKINTNNTIDLNFAMPRTIDDIHKLLPKNYFTLSNGKISSNFNRNEAYPHIKTIEFGKSFDDVPLGIISASHKVKEAEYLKAKESAEKKNDFIDGNKNKPNVKKYSDFEAAIGDGARRYASPIYISTLGNQPIITTLNHVPPSRVFPSHVTLQNELKNKLK